MELRIPGEFEIANDPIDGLLALKRGNKYYQPTFHWMERHLLLEPPFDSVYETTPSALWESVDEDTADEFLKRAL